MQKERYIVHVDMDAFFASVEQRDNHLLRNKPVVVGALPKGGRGRGVVSTCSYEARKFGVHSAMPISLAYQKCPQAVYLAPDMEKYGRVSEEISKILYDFTPDVEPVSIDEAFLDITGSFHLFGTPIETCRLIKKRIKSEVGLACSVGLAPNKMTAKIASDLKKPDGLVEVREESLLDFLWPLEVDKIWGLGEKTKIILNAKGINTIGDLARQEVERLIKLFGKNGLSLWELANGKDAREIETDREAKSMSNETTFEKDTLNQQKIDATLLFLCEEVSARLRAVRLKARTVTLKIRLEGFVTYTRASTLYKATNFVDVIYNEIKRLNDNFQHGNKRVRLVGVKASGLMPAEVEDTLFKDDSDGKKEKLHLAADKIRNRFGDTALHRAASAL